MLRSEFTRMYRMDHPTFALTAVHPQFTGVLGMGFGFLNRIEYCIGYNFCQWQLINYWDDCHLELIPRPSSATEMNFQRVFECENAWSGRAGARNRIRKERF